MLPTPAAAVLLPVAQAFTTPTFERFLRLTVAAIRTTGRRTRANLRRTLGSLASAHCTSYPRLLGWARGSGPKRTGCLCRLLLHRLPTDRPIVRLGDDSVEGPKGKRLGGKARPRDPVRSRHGCTA
jgi:hypothetical protein